MTHSFPTRRSSHLLGIDDLPYVGAAKGPDRNAGRETFYLPDGREFTLPPNNAVLFYIQRLRDEAHRFAIGAHRQKRAKAMGRSEEHTSELQSLMRISYAVFCLTKKTHSPHR